MSAAALLLERSNKRRVASSASGVTLCGVALPEARKPLRLQSLAKCSGCTHPSSSSAPIAINVSVDCVGTVIAHPAAGAGGVPRLTEGGTGGFRSPSVQRALALYRARAFKADKRSTSAGGDADDLIIGRTSPDQSASSESAKEQRVPVAAKEEKDEVWSGKNMAAEVAAPDPNEVVAKASGEIARGAKKRGADDAGPQGGGEMAMAVMHVCHSCGLEEELGVFSLDP